MSSTPSPDEIARDARWLAQALDPGAGLVRLIEMTPEAYRAASFLDDRMLQQPVNAQLMRWDDVVSGFSPDARRDTRWIFHIGHVGSTLVARLLGELDGVLSVREPRILRDISMLPPDRRSVFFNPISQLFSRTFGPTQIPLVKATSFVSEIAGELVSQGQPSLFLFTQPRAYIESILAGENSRKELQVLATSRAGRMKQRVPIELSGKTEAHMAAAAWACEMTALEMAADSIGAQFVKWADFDQMLINMSESLLRLTNFLQLPATVERLEQITSGPLMRRYSKALEYDYSPDLRRELLKETEVRFRRDIDNALELLGKAAQSSPLLQRALARTASET